MAGTRPPEDELMLIALSFDNASDATSGLLRRTMIADALDDYARYLERRITGPVPAALNTTTPAVGDRVAFAYTVPGAVPMGQLGRGTITAVEGERVTIEVDEDYLSTGAFAAWREAKRYWRDVAVIQ